MDTSRGREKGTKMTWTVFMKATGKLVKDGFECEVDAQMWIFSQPNSDELDCCPF
jgi:hypothetical protein